jgi:hypothetical protein
LEEKVCLKLDVFSKNVLILHGITAYVIEKALFISIFSLCGCAWKGVLRS